MLDIRVCSKNKSKDRLSSLYINTASPRSLLSPFSQISLLFRFIAPPLRLENLGNPPHVEQPMAAFLETASFFLLISSLDCYFGIRSLLIRVIKSESISCSQIGLFRSLSGYENKDRPKPSRRVRSAPLSDKMALALGLCVD